MALTETLSGAELVLHDINADALKFMTAASKRVVKKVNGALKITASLDREETLRGADFVVLCVGLGGSRAVRNDLEIPEKYGIYQTVGDTVGPGGLARGLRHIPFAIQVAREMEDLCPDAWLLNLSNPMSTICRGVTRATSIRTIGLCHEVTGFRYHMAALFEVPVEKIQVEAAGINHLPVITRFIIDGGDGFGLLREWLSEHGAFGLVDDSELTNVFTVFRDQLAVKLILFEQLGVLFGAGDRHITEFFSTFLTEKSRLGRQYGVFLTTADHRDEMERQRRAIAENFTPPHEVSAEQLAPVMGSLLGGPAGQYILNIPNLGQVENLPVGAVVECVARIDALGVQPLAVGSLPHAAHAAVAPHVDRHELIVEAVLTGNQGHALTALATDPLIRDQHTVAPLFDELVAANEDVLQEMEKYIAETDRERLDAEMTKVSEGEGLEEISEGAHDQQPAFSVRSSSLGQLLEDEAAKAILEKHFPGMLQHPMLKMALGMTLEQIAPFAPQELPEETMQAVDEELSQL
jgi:alpha-galactosidase